MEQVVVDTHAIGAEQIASELIVAPKGEDTCHIIATLARFGVDALTLLKSAGTRVVLLRKDQRYDDASPALRRLGVDVDGWPAPPAGLFVVEERTVYLRSRSAMTVGHETGHALDCALGNGVYLSSISPDIRKMFAAATAYVTPYSASACDEYMAENFRAYIEANDPASFWPRATRARLRRVDPQAYAFIEQLFTSKFRIANSASAA